MVPLKVGVTDYEPERLQLRNNETFSLTLLDDVWLSVSAPNVALRSEGPFIEWRGGWFVYLRCQTPRVIPPGGNIEIIYSACSATTYEPGVDARLEAFNLVAREGYRQGDFDHSGPVIVRKR
jgi:hypothetical protein